NEWLPSFNAAFELRPDLLLRVGAYRAMSRPDLAALGYGRSFNLDEVDTEFGSVADALGNITATGNPRASPLMSWNADVSLEWYANADSMLS
ncbi:TonB-dependent receptor, partial [Mycobacterium tuberculosis]|nr:TonB-dependent receptor [Mycobacterium tuberculosis]